MIGAAPIPAFHEITEQPGIGATTEQLRMLATRYRLARDHAGGGTVVEVACGTGIGLGLLAGAATTVIGGDIDERNLERARATYRDRPGIVIQAMNADRLPFASGS